MEIEKNRFEIKYDRAITKLLSALKCADAMSIRHTGKVIFIIANCNKSSYQIPISFKKSLGIALLYYKIAIANLDEILMFKLCQM